MDSAVEHMKKPLFVHTVPMAQLIGKFRPQGRTAANSPSTSNDPTHHGGERVACKCTASETQYMQRGSNNDLRNMRGRTGSPQRLLPHATIVSAKGSSETIQTSEPHLNTALPHVQRSRVPRSREPTAGRVASHRLCVVCYVLCASCMLYVVCCCYHACRVSCALCVRGPVCCCCCVCRVCRECVITLVVLYAPTMSLYGFPQPEKSNSNHVNN